MHCTFKLWFGEREGGLYCQIESGEGDFKINKNHVSEQNVPGSEIPNVNLNFTAFRANTQTFRKEVEKNLKTSLIKLYSIITPRLIL